jgi:hypothetical protein
LKKLLLIDISEKGEEKMFASPDDLIEKAIKKVDKIYKTTFISAVIIGMIAHGYMFMNKLPNYDDVNCINSVGGTFQSGRWFLGLLGVAKFRVMGNYSLPLFNGMLALCLLALSSCLIMSLFHNKSVITGIIVSGIMVSFPTITGFFLFMFTSVFYAFSIFLVTVAVYLWESNRRWYVLGCLCMMGALGIYQAVFPFGLSLCIYLLIFQLLKGEKTVEKVFWTAWKYLGLLIVSVIGYGIVAVGFIWRFGLTEHKTGSLIPKGMNEVFQRITNMFTNFPNLILRDYCGISYNIYVRILIIILFGTMIGLIFFGIFKAFKRNEVQRGFLLIVLSALLPIAVNLLYLLGTEIYVLMIYAIVCVLVFPVLCLNDKSAVESKTSIINSVLQYIVVGTSALLLFVYISLANETYLAMELAISEMQSYTTTLITQIKSVEGYKENMPVAFVGKNDDKTVLHLQEEIFYNLDKSVFRDAIYMTSNDYYWKQYMSLYCGFDFLEAGNIEDMVDYEKVRQMPEYPNFGSIQVIGDIVVVKFSNALK